MGKCRYDLSKDCSNKDCIKCILDEIRAEIEKVFCMSVVTNELRTPMEVKADILQIVDKYKAEINPQESAELPWSKGTIQIRRGRMKIIGKSENGYIITATADEIANLQGLYSHYSDEFKVNVGDELNIEPFYDMAREANNIRNRRDELESVARHIDSALRIIDFVTKAEDKE